MQKPDYKCPFANFKPCMGHGCALYIQVRGMDNNTGKEIDQWGCAQAFMPVLMIENSNQQRQTAAAVESFRNEMVTAQQQLMHAQGVIARALMAQSLPAINGAPNARFNHQA